MLTLHGKSYRLCDGRSRRDFLRLGGLGLGGRGRPDLLRQRARGCASPSKSVIMLFLSGGPGHIDRCDMKADRFTLVHGIRMPTIVTHNTEPIAKLL